jgi:S-DNA-T family DNA segregation ATPase FtsK/SpoIIIE
VLLGGQTMGGKSNMLHVMICTFIARNSAEDVRLVLLDLKFGGIELGRYEGIPHLITDIPMLKKKPKEDAEAEPVEVEDDELEVEPLEQVSILAENDPYADEEIDEEKAFNGIAANPEQAVSVLKWAVREGNRRGKLFMKEKIQNLKQWNRKHKTRRMAEVVICVDELAQLRLDPDFGRDAYNLIRELGSVARAAGIHLMASTQSSNKRVIDEMVKVNFPMRICFSVPDASSSVLFVGTGQAINLSPAGRAVYKHGTDNFAAQTPLIEASEISQIIAKAKTGEKVKNLNKIHITPEEIIDWAIEDNGSSLAVMEVRHKFGERIEARALEQILKDMEGGTFVVGDRTYQVLPGSGKKPRIVVRV